MLVGGHIDGQMLVCTFFIFLRVKTLKKHRLSRPHMLCVAAEDPTQPKPKSKSRVDENKLQSTIGGMKAAFFLVMNDIPNAKFKNLEAWSRHMGVAEIASFHNGPRATHDSPTTFIEVNILMFKL